MNNLRTVLACLSCAMFCERFVDDDLSTAVFQSWSTAVFAFSSLPACPTRERKEKMKKIIGSGRSSPSV